MSIRYRLLFHGVNLPLNIDPEKLLQLLKEVREGDETAIEEMILGHVRLAISIVNRYLDPQSSFDYDGTLDSAAMEGVVVAVNRIAKGKMLNHNNATGYIVKYIHQYVVSAINHSRIVYTPRGQKNKFTEPLPDRLSGKDSQLGIQEFEIWDLIENLSKNDTEKRILELKRKGFTDSEIGEIVGLSRLLVLRIRHNLFQRYLTKGRE